jgi:predicted GNAT family N-acyltransferase
MNSFASDIVFEFAPHGSPRYREAVELRRRVLRLPLGRDYSAEELAAEAPHRHLVGLKDNVVIACLMLTAEPDGTVRIRAVAVAPEQRGQGIGRALSDYAEAQLRLAHTPKLKLHARLTAVGFYETLGYRAEGKPFDENGLPHILMRKTL